jgi:hypothetical protein
VRSGINAIAAAIELLNERRIAAPVTFEEFRDFSVPAIDASSTPAKTIGIEVQDSTLACKASVRLEPVSHQDVDRLLAYFCRSGQMSAL